MKEQFSIKPNNKNQLVKVDKNGDSPLHLAAVKGDFNSVEQCILDNAPLNLKNNSGYTPLDLAIHAYGNSPLKKENYRQIIVTLLNNGADPNIYQHSEDNQFEYSPLFRAVSYADLPIAQMLSKHTFTPSQIMTDSLIEGKEQHIPWYNLLLKKILKHNNWPHFLALLHSKNPLPTETLNAIFVNWALEQDYDEEKILPIIQQIRVLQNLGFNLTQLDSNKNSMLSIICEKYDISTNVAIALISTFGEAHVNSVNIQEQGFVHCLATHDRVNALKALVTNFEFDVNVNAQDKDGNTPLHIAAAGKKEVVASLMEAGASKLIKNFSGMSAKDTYSAYYNDLEQHANYEQVSSNLKNKYYDMALAFSTPAKKKEPVMPPLKEKPSVKNHGTFNQIPIDEILKQQELIKAIHKQKADEEQAKIQRNYNELLLQKKQQEESENTYWSDSELLYDSDVENNDFSDFSEASETEEYSEAEECSDCSSDEGECNVNKTKEHLKPK